MRSGASTAAGPTMGLASALSNLHEMLNMVGLLDDVSESRSPLILIRLTDQHPESIGPSFSEGGMEPCQIFLPYPSCTS